MKFGKVLRGTIESRMPQWRDQCLNYKQLKQATRQMSHQRETTGLGQEQACSSFTSLLDVEVEKVNEFYSDRIEEAVIILHALQQHVTQLAAQGSPHDQRTACQRSLVSINFNLLMLQNFVALNFTSIVKALKKFDKKLGAALRTDYIAAIVELPFYQCQALGQLVEETEKLFRQLESGAASQRQLEMPAAVPKAGCGPPMLQTLQQAGDASRA